MSQHVTDLRIVVLLGAAAMFALLVPGVPWQVEWMFGFPLLLLLPGYAAVAALFPERPDAPANGHRSPDWPARFGLSLVLSAIIVAGIGVLIASSGLTRLTLTSIVLSIVAVTVLGVGLAAVRRRPLPRHRRADPVAVVASESVVSGVGTTGVQSLVLVFSIVLLATTLAFVGTSPAEDPYSEVYLTGGEDVNIQPMNETQTMVAGAENTVSLTVENHEGVRSDYRVVILLQRVGDDGTVQVVERLDDFRVRLAPGDVSVYERVLVPTMTGEQLRFQVLVDKGSPEGNIDTDSADLSLRLYINVTEEGSI